MRGVARDNLEAQAVNAVADRLSGHGVILDLSCMRQLLDELVRAGLLKDVWQKGRVGGAARWGRVEQSNGRWTGPIH